MDKQLIEGIALEVAKEIYYGENQSWRKDGIINEFAYRFLARIDAERDDLAAQVETMREALEDTAQALAWQAHGECRGFSNKLLPSNDALDKARKAISLPNASAILRQRDARTAASALRDYVKTIPGGSIVDPQLIADDMRRVAEELERKNG